MDWKLFADLAEIAGSSEITVDVETPEPTVDDALAALLQAHPELESRIFTAEGELESHLTLLKNGENVGETGLSTTAEADDELALFPPVSGG